MNDPMHEIVKELEELLEEPELIEESHHKKAEHAWLWARNICVGFAALLFLASFPLHHIHGLLRGIGYLFGATAYIAELGMLTDNFTTMVAHKELFMVYCFGPLYLLMGLAYLLE